MAKAAPQIWSMSGSFSGSNSSFNLYPNANASTGFVADYMEINSFAQYPLVARYNGSDFYVLPLSTLKLPGPISSVTLTPMSGANTGSNTAGFPSFTAYASAGTGELPTGPLSLAAALLLASGSGGGGGGGTAQNVVFNATTAPSGWTNGLPILALSAPFELRRAEASSNSDTQLVEQLTAHTSQPTEAAGFGAGLMFRHQTQTGGQDAAYIKSRNTGGGYAIDFGIGSGDVATLTNDKLTLSSLSGGSFLSEHGDCTVGTNGTGDLVLKALNQVVATVSPTGFEGHGDTLYTSDSGDVIIRGSGGSGKVTLIEDSMGGKGLGIVGNVIRIGDLSGGGKYWELDDTQSFSISGSDSSTMQIKSIADGTDPHDAVTLQQLQSATTVSGSMVFGADDTGSNTDQCWFQFGSQGVGNIGTTPARIFNFIPQNFDVTGIFINCGTPPSGADQTFVFMEGTSPISPPITLTAGSNTAIWTGSPLHLSAHANYTVKSVAGTGTGAIGAKDVMVYVYYVPA